jgi:hypothetical protein
MDTVVLIHGAWVTPWCWRYFAPHFSERGYRTMAPAWPFKDSTQTDPRLARVGIP